MFLVYVIRYMIPVPLAGWSRKYRNVVKTPSTIVIFEKSEGSVAIPREDILTYSSTFYHRRDSVLKNNHKKQKDWQLPIIYI